MLFNLLNLIIYTGLRRNEESDAPASKENRFKGFNFITSEAEASEAV